MLMSQPATKKTWSAFAQNHASAARLGAGRAARRGRREGRWAQMLDELELVVERALVVVLGELELGPRGALQVRPILMSTTTSARRRRRCRCCGRCVWG